MVERIESPDPLEQRANTEASLSLASAIGMAGIGEFRTILSAMRGDTNISSPATTVSDSNGRARESRGEGGSRERIYDLGGRAQWDAQNRLISMTDRPFGDTFHFTYEGNGTEPSRIQGTNGLDYRPGLDRARVDHQNGQVQITNEGGSEQSYSLNGNRTTTLVRPGSSDNMVETTYNPADDSITSTSRIAGSDSIRRS